MSNRCRQCDDASASELFNSTENDARPDTATAADSTSDAACVTVWAPALTSRMCRVRGHSLMWITLNQITHKNPLQLRILTNNRYFLTINTILIVKISIKEDVPVCQLRGVAANWY